MILDRFVTYGSFLNICFFMNYVKKGWALLTSVSHPAAISSFGGRQVSRGSQILHSFLTSVKSYTCLWSFRLRPSKKALCL